MRSENGIIREKIQFYKIEDDSKVLYFANKLLKGELLCLNLEDCQLDQGDKVIHFLSGVNYATDGLVKTLKANVFLFGLKEHFKDPVVKKFIQDYSI